MFLGYWGYFLLVHAYKISDLFPFRCGFYSHSSTSETSLSLAGYKQHSN